LDLPSGGVFGTERPVVKQSFSLLPGAGLMAAVAVPASLPSPDLFARVHFAGAAQTPGGPQPFPLH